MRYKTPESGEQCGIVTCLRELCKRFNLLVEVGRNEVGSIGSDEDPLVLGSVVLLPGDEELFIELFAGA